jgi:hypothetical protein
MASKLEVKKFNKKVGEIVLKFGGKVFSVREDGHTVWELETKAGRLDVTVFAPESSKLFSIFACFDDNKKAVEVLSDWNKVNLNIHSGKWNQHSSDKVGCLVTFSAALDEIKL